MGDKEFKDFLNKDVFIKKSLLSDSIFLTNFFLVEFELPDDGNKPLAKRTKIMDTAENMGLIEADNTELFSTKLTFNVSKISMPGQRIGLKRSDIIGPQRFTYSKKEYDDLSISFIESADMKIKNFFKFWISRGFNDITGQRKFFPDEISANIIVYPLDPDGSLIPCLYDNSCYVCEIFGKCLPYEVSDYEYDYTNDDNTLKLTDIKFAYRYHISQFEKEVKLPKF